VQTDGKVLVGGKFSTVNGVNRHNLARLNIDGTLDTGFQNPLSGSKAQWLSPLQSDGKVLVGGGFTPRRQPDPQPDCTAHIDAHWMRRSEWAFRG